MNGRRERHRANLSTKQRIAIDKKLNELRVIAAIRSAASLLKNLGFTGVIVLGDEYFNWKETPLDDAQATQLIGIVDGYLNNEKLRTAIQSQKEGNQP